MKISNASLLSTCLALLAAPVALIAQTIVNVSTSQYATSAGGMEISVFNGNSFINGDVTSTAISDVVDYAFFHTSTTASLAGSASILPNTITSAGSGSSRQTTNFYTTSNPTSLTPDASFNQFTIGTGKTASMSGISFSSTNDVTLYIIHGGWDRVGSITLTDGTNNWTENLARGPARELEYVTAFTISGFDVNDTFSFSTAGAINNPTLIGVIATQAVPEPSVFGLVALSGLAFVFVRRRR